MVYILFRGVTGTSRYETLCGMCITGTHKYLAYALRDVLVVWVFLNMRRKYYRIEEEANDHER